MEPHREGPDDYGWAGGGGPTAPGGSPGRGGGAGRPRADRVIDARGLHAFPGLRNGHTHAAMTLFRGWGDDLPLMEWLEKHIFPAEAAHVDEEFVRAGTRLACLEMLRGGTTTFADMYYFEEAIAEETAAIGMRALLGQTVLVFPAPDAEVADTAAAAVDRRGIDTTFRTLAMLVPTNYGTRLPHDLRDSVSTWNSGG